MTNVLDHLGLSVGRAGVGTGNVGGNVGGDVGGNVGGYVGPVPKISVVILAHNESGNIGECLRSCGWCDDVHVVDSGSTDDTVAIAQSMGATVHHHGFESFGAQRNWAIDHAGCGHGWQFHLDADERFTAGLVREIAGRLSDESHGEVAYLVPSRMVFLGKWLRRSGGYPGYQMRLFRSDQCRFTDVGHGQREDTMGSVGVIGEPYIHFNFSKGIEAWLRKHNRYSEQEAIAAVAALAEPMGWGEIFSRDGVLRRRALKRLSQRLPFRGWQRWVYTMVIKRGWMDGQAGRQYTRMICMYERWIERKIRERRRVVVDGESVKPIGLTWTNRIDHQIDVCVGECEGVANVSAGMSMGKFIKNKIVFGLKNDAAVMMRLLVAEGDIRRK